VECVIQKQYWIIRMPSPGIWRHVDFVWTDVAAATCSSLFLACWFFYPEDGDDMFLRNVGSHKIYTAPHPRIRHLHTQRRENLKSYKVVNNLKWKICWAIKTVLYVTTSHFSLRTSTKPPSSLESNYFEQSSPDEGYAHSVKCSYYLILRLLLGCLVRTFEIHMFKCL
jgi:hypothetical protein